jgi:Flp pilus assembly protein TadG
MYERSTTSSRRGRQRGIVAVEMAITLPFLLLLMLSIAELGRVLFQSNMLTKATRDAARYLAAEAIVGGTDVIQIDAALESETKNLLMYGSTTAANTPILPHLSAGDITVSSPDTVHVSVVVNYTYRSMLGAALPSFGLGDELPLDIPLAAAVIMRAL